jgi:3-oxoacyl-[acyl-carrier protein] reductase
MEFKKKTVVVTGASRGLGLAIARGFWDAGADLFLVARSSHRLEETAAELSAERPDQRAGFLADDLADPGAPRRIFAALGQFGNRLDVLVNNAASLGPIGPISENDSEEWQRTLQVNLAAPAALCREAIRWMKQQGEGVILNLSGGGATSPRPNFSAYAAAKAGLVRLSETIAAEVSGDGIRVNCIAPGAMNTEMHQAVLRAGAEASGEQEYRKAVEQAREGGMQMEVPAALAVYLASPACSGITGRLISAAWDPWRGLHVHSSELAASDIYTLRRVVPQDRGLQWA